MEEGGGRWRRRRPDVLIEDIKQNEQTGRVWLSSTPHTLLVSSNQKPQKLNVLH